MQSWWRRGGGAGVLMAQNTAPPSLCPKEKSSKGRKPGSGRKSPPSQRVMAGCEALPGGWEGLAEGPLLYQPETSACRRWGTRGPQGCPGGTQGHTAQP